MPNLLVVEPVFAERLWGGTTLRRWFGPAVPDGVIGECWAVSGMSDMSGHIRSGSPDGFTLRQAWAAGLVTGEPRQDEFPLLCKFLAPQDWLSVQVHPDDAQARALEGQPRGKAECWLVVSASQDAELILGHTAASAGQLREALAEGTLMEHLVTVPVAQDDFFMVAAGEVHSLGPGMLVYEVQQSSDITYRLYDFDRVGLDGRLRQLHVDKGFSVVRAPHDPATARTAGPWEQIRPRGRHRVLVDAPQFLVQRWELLHEHCIMEAPSYRVLTVIGGWGRLSTQAESVELGMGMSVVIPAGAGPVVLEGDLIAITTDPGPGL